MLPAPAGQQDRHRPHLQHPAPVAAAVSSTRDAAGEAAHFSLATPTTRAGLTAATAGTDGILPPTSSLEVATAVDADTAVKAAAATCPSRIPLTSYRVYSGHSLCPCLFFYCNVILSLCKYLALIP